MNILKVQEIKILNFKSLWLSFFRACSYRALLCPSSLEFWGAVAFSGARLILVLVSAAPYNPQVLSASGWPSLIFRSLRWLGW